MYPVCDLSKMNMDTSGKKLSWECEKLFICGTMKANAEEITITTDSIFVANGAGIKSIPPTAAANGQSGNDSKDL